MPVEDPKKVQRILGLIFESSEKGMNRNGILHFSSSSANRGHSILNRLMNIMIPLHFDTAGEDDALCGVSVRCAAAPTTTRKQ